MPDSPDAADLAAPFDLIVVGGGVQGLMTAMIAAEGGRRVALLEKDRVGQATSAAWFRILHGGLRYLQSMDIPRLRASSSERRWFLQNFPSAFTPLPFLMPLYSRGLKRPAAFRAAFAADAALTWDRNRGVDPAQQIERGRVLGAEEVARLYPGVRRDGLTGGALWREAVAPDETALTAALLDRARRAGVVICEGVAAHGLLTEDGRTAGVDATSSGGETATALTAPVVINAAGPWSGDVAGRLDPHAPDLFSPALGFNILLNRPPPASVGLSLTPPGEDGAMLFLYPRSDRVFAGTWYEPWAGGADAPAPSDGAIEAFLAALNAAAPTLGATRADIADITCGLLPARDAGGVDLMDRDVIHDHGAAGGPRGLFTAVGVKFTTARRLARRTLANAGLT
ncbi:MAG: FAD-dependent oxidoreductase [Pseudomonadota bacterium]